MLVCGKQLLGTQRFLEKTAMVGEVFAGIGAFKTMFDMAKALKDINDATIRNGAIIELQEKILAARDEQTALLERISGLEKEVAVLKAWDADKERYQLTEVCPGVYAYTPKAGMERGEPFHMLCANCYGHREKSLLQATQELRMRRRVHKCPRCQSEFEMAYVGRQDSKPGQAIMDYDPFTGR